MIRNGQMTRFWADPWLHETPLNLIAPFLYELCENKLISIAQVIGGEQVKFRRWLHDELGRCWEKICDEACQG